MRIKLCVLKAIHQHYPSPPAWKPSLFLRQECICSATEPRSRLFCSPELLTLCTPGRHAHTRIPSAALGSVNLGFLLILLFISPYRISCRAHSSSHGAARLDAAIVSLFLRCCAQSRVQLPGWQAKVSSRVVSPTMSPVTDWCLWRQSTLLSLTFFHQFI